MIFPVGLLPSLGEDGQGEEESDDEGDELHLRRRLAVTTAGIARWGYEGGPGSDHG